MSKSNTVKTFEYNGQEYSLVFNLNVMESIQAKYGSVQAWGELTEGEKDGEPNLEAVLYGFTEMVNEGIEIYNDENDKKRKLLTKKQVGRLITNIGLAEAAGMIQSSVTGSTTVETKN